MTSSSSDTDVDEEETEGTGVSGSLLLAPDSLLDDEDSLLSRYFQGSVDLERGDERSSVLLPIPCSQSANVAVASNVSMSSLWRICVGESEKLL